MTDLHPSSRTGVTTRFRDRIDVLRDEIRRLYTADGVPWVVGYSGGKDSTAVLQLVWGALVELPEHQRQKPVYVISTDTLVENPVVAVWVSNSLDTMRTSAINERLPFDPRRLTPKVSDTFWVNLIGRGYPAPRPRFRWCTERLKINPSNDFIRGVVQEHGETILVLGTRKAESARRARNMEQHEQRRTRERLSPNASLPNSLIYSPIEDWSTDDVWLFLMQEDNPWGVTNKDLLTIYRGASADAECPLVVDSSTPSCGDSRFGCWVCTLVEQDKSMQAMIQNDEEKEWMLPLLELRNELDLQDDRARRDFRRMSGLVQLHNDRPIPGPYTQESRERWLRRLLEVQRWVRANGPEHVRSLELITMPELHEIRRMWVFDKHEIEDRLPLVYQEATGEPFPAGRIDDGSAFGDAEMQMLREICGDPLHFQLVRELISVEHRFQTSVRRAGVYESLEGAFRRGSYADEDDAVDMAKRRRAALNRVRVDSETEPAYALDEDLILLADFDPAA